MNTMAAAETKRKKGLRMPSGTLRRKLQAPPGFCAKMKSRCPGMASMCLPERLRSGPASAHFAHSLVPIQRFWMRAMLRIKCYKFSSVLRIEYGRKSP